MTRTASTKKSKSAHPPAGAEQCEPSPSTRPTPEGATSEPKGKLGAMLALLRRAEGARMDELVAATGWQAHSVRGALSGALKKKLGLTVLSLKTDAGRTYRIVDDAGEAKP